MEFEFIDSRKWTYTFTVSENIHSPLKIKCTDGTCIFTDDTYVIDGVIIWKATHTRGALISQEAREFCETKVASYMKMKAFW
jgi:hypothetical protein